MVRSAPLSSSAPTGAYAVRMPRETDAVAAALRNAYATENLPAELRKALEALNRVQ